MLLHDFTDPQTTVDVVCACVADIVYCYLFVKATLNRCVFRMDLKFSRDDVFLIFACNLFHKMGAATLNLQSPYDLN